jgi:hypothetical protein
MRVIALLALATWIAPAAAQAQGNDPAAGSPSGTIYEIPLDSARGDAAPRDPSASAANADQPSSSSPIHSDDNGFGSSAQVPGAPPAAPVKGSGSGSSSGKGGGTAKPPAKREGGEGASSEPAHTNAEALIRPAARAAAPSSTRAYALLVFAIGVAVALGIAGRLAARRR